MNHRSFNTKTYTRRNSNRLPFYNYRSPGAYFVAICTYKRQRALEIPRIHITALEKWLHLPQCFPGVCIDAFKIMPDHMQGILWLDGNVKNTPNLGSVVGAWKGQLTIAWRNYHRATNIPCLSHLWQRDYYEHVIRNKEDLELTCGYILNNPLKALLMQEHRYAEMQRAKKDGVKP